ncbi:NERD domain-containing protein [Shewanella sp. BF02_Schw]|uniref:nuclease-related domain-containing protein n=1 Tax=Shewanella sp. BF02_Schw TaxID=394908 RepID=UPI00177C62FF|nr:nuclease-related domain-containing protein [Shewanella sp. BF02_Schw]MBO1896173.1 NERD domain-containing protein [Shewanella sp. BF02_Schw]
MTSLFTNVFATIILLSGMFLMVLIMHLMLKYRDHTVKLPVDREQLQRIPAFGLQQQIQDLQFDLIAGLTMAVIVVTFPFAYESIVQHISDSSFPTAFAPIVIIGLGYYGHKTWKNFSKLTKLRLGHTAEIATANELIGLQALGYQVFHDIQADGFNIDHLAIGKNGVFAIETKGRHKRKRDSKSTSATQGKDYQLFYKDGRLCFPSWTETKPIEQAERQAKWVSQWLTKATGQQVFSSPVLVFPGWYVTSQTRPPFPILNHKQLVKTIPAVRTQTLSQQQVDAIVYQVAQRCLSKSEVGK